MHTELNVMGRLTITEFNPQGEAVRVVRGKNMVVATGRTWVWNKLCGYSSKRLVQLAVGDGTTAVADTDAALVDQLYAADITSLVVSGNTLTCEYYLPAGATDANDKTLTEAGLFTDVTTTETTATMVARIVHDAVAKTANNSLLYSWTLTLTAV